MALSSILTAAVAATTPPRRWQQRGESTWTTASTSTAPAGQGDHLGTARAASPRPAGSCPPPSGQLEQAAAVRPRPSPGSPACPSHTRSKEGPDSPEAADAATSASNMEGRKKNNKKTTQKNPTIPKSQKERRETAAAPRPRPRAGFRRRTALPPATAALNGQGARRGRRELVGPCSSPVAPSPTPPPTHPPSHTPPHPRAQARWLGEGVTRARRLSCTSVRQPTVCAAQRSLSPPPAATPELSRPRKAAGPEGGGRSVAPHLVEAVLAVGFRLYLHLHHHRVRPGHIAQHG